MGIYRNPCILDICGRQVKIRFVDNPDRSTLIPSTTIIILLFDLTNEVIKWCHLDQYLTAHLAGHLLHTSRKSGDSPESVSRVPEGSSWHQS